MGLGGWPFGEKFGASVEPCQLFVSQKAGFDVLLGGPFSVASNSMCPLERCEVFSSAIATCTHFRRLFHIFHAKSMKLFFDNFNGFSPRF